MLRSALIGLFLASLPGLHTYAVEPNWRTILPPIEQDSAASLAEANQALRDTFTLQGVQGVAPRRRDGGFDWDSYGPRNDPEWAWFFNRHSYFTALVKSYLQTRDDSYAEFLFATLDDWIVQHPSPGRLTFSAAWRPLEAARRILNSWTFVHLRLSDHPAFTPERRARFLASVHDHGEQLRHHHALYGNHLITEMLALAQLSLVYSEDPNSGEWLNYSLKALEAEYSMQVYPDGAHTELSAHYQRVVALNYQRLLTLLEASARQELADIWRPRVHRLWAYFQAIMQPAGGNPLSNDSDQENLQLLLRANAPDLATTLASSRWLPYAGQAVFRSPGPQAGNQNALWAFFDIGPRGTDHDHADRLHLSLSVGTREFLVDNGRFTYRPGLWREYFAGATSHNTVLVDQEGAEQGPRKVASPDKLGHFFSREDMEVAYGDATFATASNPRTADWRRIVVHLNGKGWLVVDRIAIFQPAILSTLWHWHPLCDIHLFTQDQGQVIRHGAGSLRMQLASNNHSGTWHNVRGSSQPIQGWYSDRFNFKTPATCTTYEQRSIQPVTNVWLITPQSNDSLDSILAVQFNTSGRLKIQFGKPYAFSIDPERPEDLTRERPERNP